MLITNFYKYRAGKSVFRPIRRNYIVPKPIIRPLSQLMGAIVQKKILILLLTYNVLGLSLLHADEQGRQIMEKNNALKKPLTVMNKSVMVILRGGGKEFKEFNVFNKRYGNQVRSRLIFSTPVKLDFISWSDPGKNTRQWMNLSGNFQELATSDMRSEFMGSHFYFEDLGEYYLDDYDYTLIGEEIINENNCYKIEARRKKGMQVYVKTILYLRKSDYFVIQIDFFEKRGHTKTLSLDQIEVINGITLARKITMSRVGGKDRSIIYLKNIEYDKPVPDSIFQP